MSVRASILVAIGMLGAVWAAHPAHARQDGRYEAGFERDVNRYRWSGLMNMTARVGAWEIIAEDRFRSDAFLLFDDRLSFRDENGLSIAARRPLAGVAALRFVGRSDWFSLSRVLSQTIYAGLELTPGSGLRIEPMAGLAMDRRPGVLTADGVIPLRSDAGPAVGLAFDLPRTASQGYNVQAGGTAFWHQIAPRRSGGARLSASADRLFEATRVRADVQAASIRRDAYQAASFLNRDEAVGRSAESVESTRSDTVDAGLSVQAPLSTALLLDGGVRFGANNRFIRTLRAPEGALFFDSDFNRHSADVAMNLVYRRGSAEVRAGFEGGAETERRRLANEDALPGPQAAQKSDLLRQADYDRGFLALRIDGRIPISKRVTLQADGSANGIRHDTPIINLDDRDEVFYNGRMGLLIRADETFDVDMQVFGTYYHTVYLKAARSAENNVQRSLRLRPAVRWRPDRRTRLELASEVRATYTVEDFVLPGRRPTDQSARELRYDWSFSRQFGEGLRLLADGRFSDLRLGRFLKDTFAEIPFDTLRSTGAWVRIQVGRRTTAEFGIRTFVRSDYDRAATVRYHRVEDDGTPVLDDAGAPVMTTITRAGKERILQFGPTCSVVIPMRGGAHLRLEGWFTIQYITHELYGDLPEISADGIRRAASRGQRTTIPNLAVSWVWDF